ncbi:SDR family NAD(P)-dependent oxidoreductase [Corynebacterium amycolatum]|nr:SDR family NAD(P)-dependent oxidoreductase [Corynebacterium amycolatum]MEB2596945.1 SDR family NAD(P)-dependent oxidoreductase [Corynebacterium amycolatum]
MTDGLTGAFANLTRGPKLPSVGGGRALVTGASSGIGWACAEALVKDGFEVVGTSRRGAEAPHPEGVQMVALRHVQRRRHRCCGRPRALRRRRRQRR